MKKLIALIILVLIGYGYYSYTNNWRNYLDKDGFDTQDSYRMRNKVSKERLALIESLHGKEYADIVRKAGYEASTSDTPNYGISESMDKVGNSVIKAQRSFKSVRDKYDDLVLKMKDNGLDVVSAEGDLDDYILVIDDQAKVSQDTLDEMKNLYDEDMKRMNEFKREDGR